MIGDGAIGVECRGCRGQKTVKLTTIGVKWKNQRHRRPCLCPASLQVEARHRKVNHVPTRLHMEEFAREKIGAWRCIDHWLMPGFLPTGRLGPGVPSGGVVVRRWSSRWKSSLENFHSSRGSLMVAEDSRDG